MRINLRILAAEDARAALRSDPQIAEACDLDGVVFELDSQSALFDRFLQLTRGTSGSWLNPVMSFSKAEQNQVSLFQLEGRKLLRESESDYELNAARLEELPFAAVHEGSKVKLLDRVALTRIALKPNAVGLVGDWTPEFIVGSAAARAFEQEKLTGFSLLPVLNPKTGRHHDDFRQLFSDRLMPPAELDATTPLTGAQGADNEGGPRQLGCLTYRLADAQPPQDFNRTVENWSSNFLPLWVVSARVREAFSRHKLKGWAFRPVLELDSPLHETYLTMWSDLLDRVSVNPRNHF